MINYVTYKDSGRVYSWGTCQKVHEKDICLDGRYLLCEEIPSDISNKYVKNGTLIDKPPMPITQDSLTLSEVPLGCQIYVDEQLSVENNQKETITIEKEHEGDTYHLRFVLFPYLDFEVTV